MPQTRRRGGTCRSRRFPNCSPPKLPTPVTPRTSPGSARSSAPKPPTPEQGAPMRPALEGDLRVAVVGTGRMGANHAERLARTTQRARVSAVVDIDTDRANAVGSNVGRLQGSEVRVFSSIEQVLAAEC